MNRPHLDAERSTNPLLLALKRGGPMHHVIASAGTFDAVLLPSTSVVQQAGLAAVFEYGGDDRLPSDFSAASPLQGAPQTSSGGKSAAVDGSEHPASWFLLCHLIRFDNRGMSPNFCTLAGQRGAFGDALDTVARGGLIGRRVVLGHLDPLPAQTQDAYRAFLPESLNIFVVDGVMVDDEVVKECIHKVNVLRQSTAISNAATAASSASGVLGSFGSGVASWVASQVRSGKESSATSAVTTSKPTSPSADNQPSPANVAEPPSAAAATAQKARRSASEQELAIQYPEFQRLMLLPASANIAKSLHTFVDHVVLDTSDGAAAASATATATSSSASNRKGAANPPSAAALLSKEIRGFVQQLLAQIQKIPVWKGKEVVAREGIEKYICSKLYNKLFATSWSEKQKDATLKRKLSLLNAVVGAQNLDGPDGVELAPQWPEALALIRGMNDYRSPRDKMDAAIKCCAAIHRCVAYVRNRGKDKRPEKAGPPLQPDSHSGNAPPSQQQPSPAPSELDSPTTRNSSFTGLPGGLNLGGADEFLPTLILCVLRANPDSLCSNVAYIDLFRDKTLMEMSGEYDLTSLQSCCEFWLTCQAAHLRLSEEAFDTAMGNVFAKITPRTNTSGTKQREAKITACASSAQAGGPTDTPVTSTVVSSKSIVDALFDVGMADHAAANPSPGSAVNKSDTMPPSSAAVRRPLADVAHVGVQTDSELTLNAAASVSPSPDINQLVEVLAGFSFDYERPFESLTVAELKRMWTDMGEWKAQCVKLVALTRGARDDDAT